MKMIAEQIIAAVSALPPKSTPLLIAIDGRSAAGKTTLARILHDKAGWTVFHTDDFFPRPEQRTPERLNTAGGNLDRERLLEEILLPLKNGERHITHRAFDCAAGRLSEPTVTSVGEVCVIEGAYSCHPELCGLYDLRVFLDIEPEEQSRRILLRNGAEKAAQFAARWIPLEERYFAELRPREKCELYFMNRL